MKENFSFSARQAAEISGLSVRMIQYWRDEKVLPFEKGTRTYSARQLLVMCVLRDMQDKRQLKLHARRRVVRYLLGNSRRLEKVEAPSVLVFSRHAAPRIVANDQLVALMKRATEGISVVDLDGPLTRIKQCAGGSLC